MNRYFVDERVGCIAVRDRKEIDPDNHCLSPDTEGVIKFWNGIGVYKVCPTCGHSRLAHWDIKEEDRKEAEKLCEEFNLAWNTQKTTENS